jgi:predicted ATPase
LVEFLRPKELLLVLDNCEHLLGAAGDLVERVERSCPRVVVLATSREGLAIEGERVVPVPPLSSPAAGADVASASGSEAVRLFVERARAVDPDFALDSANVEPVIQICQRLDGVPLAIELAAARTAAMTPLELSRALDQRFDTLAGGRRRAVPRHQTLRAVIDWSYVLLSAPEQRLLARLAVFAGGCTREAVEAVCTGESIRRSQVFETLVGLVSKSMVVPQKEGRETRYRLLETIREYAEERLADEQATSILHGRHLAYFQELASRLGREYVGLELQDAETRALAEMDNFRAAMAYAVHTADVDSALRLFTAGGTHGQLFVVFPLPVFRLSGASYALALPGAVDHPLYPLALATEAQNAALRGDPAGAKALIDEASAAISRYPGLPPTIKMALLLARATVAFTAGEQATAGEWFMEAARQSETEAEAAVNLGAAAMHFVMADQLDRAEPLALEGLRLARRHDVQSHVILNLTALAGALADRDPDQARLRFQDAVRLWGQGVAQLQAPAQAVFVAARLGDWHSVLDLAPQAIEPLHWIGDRAVLAGVLNLVAAAVGSVESEQATAIHGMARILALGGRRPSEGSADAGGPAAGQAGFVSRLRRQTASRLREALGEQRFHEFRELGEAMPYEGVVRYVLATIERVSQAIEAAP